MTMIDTVLRLPIVAGGFLVWALVKWIRFRGRPPLPPGPPADPIIGHLRIMPSDHNDTFFYELSKKYGAFFSLFFQFHII